MTKVSADRTLNLSDHYKWIEYRKKKQSVKTMIGKGLLRHVQLSGVLLDVHLVFLRNGPNIVFNRLR